MEKIAIVCPSCQAKYKVTVQGEVNKKISFACRKCAHLIEVNPGELKPAELTTELCRVVCKNCSTEFVKNVEDDSELCYQCRIDELLRRNKKKPAQDAAAAAAPEPEKSASRYSFRNPEGLVLGPLKLRTVAVLVREKRITGNEEVSKDGEGYKPLIDFPELAEFFPDLCAKPEAVVAQTEVPLEDSQVDIPARREEQPTPPEAVSKGKAAQPASVAQPVAAEPEPRLYHLKYNGDREFGPVRKTTVLDLIECGLLKGSDQVTHDKATWQALNSDEEFRGMRFSDPESEEVEVVDLVETVE